MFKRATFLSIILSSCGSNNKNPVMPQTLGIDKSGNYTASQISCFSNSGYPDATFYFNSVAISLVINQNLSTLTFSNNYCSSTETNHIVFNSDTMTITNRKQTTTTQPCVTNISPETSELSPATITMTDYDNPNLPDGSMHYIYNTNSIGIPTKFVYIIKPLDSCYLIFTKE